MTYHLERPYFFQGISLANIAANSCNNLSGEAFSQTGLWSLNSTFVPNRTMDVTASCTTAHLKQIVATLIMDLMKNR